MSAFYLANGSFVVDKTSQEHYLKHTANQYHCAGRVHSERKPQPEMTMKPRPEMTMKPRPEMTMKPQPKMETVRPEMARVPAEESLKMARVGQGGVEKFNNCPYKNLKY